MTRNEKENNQAKSQDSISSPSDSVPTVLSRYVPTYLRRQSIFQMVFGPFREQAARVDAFLSEAVEKCDFAICIHPENLEGILKDDRVKNLFETGHGASLGGREARLEWLLRMYGVNGAELPAEEHPKYGLLVGKNRMSDLIRNPDPLYRYGSVMLVLRKENLMQRTTMTVGSSFDFRESVLKSPVPVTHPNAMCVKACPTDPHFSAFRWFNGVLFLNDLILQGRVSPDAPNLLPLAAEDMPGFENIELQFFGPIVFSRDVLRVEYMNLTGREEKAVGRLHTELNTLGISCENILDALNERFQNMEE